MLWLEYESSQTVTKQLVQEVVCGIYQLIKPSPVAAEDWNNDSGIAIIAFDRTHDDFSSSDNSDYPSINDLVTGLSLDQQCSRTGPSCNRYQSTRISVVGE